MSDSMDDWRKGIEEEIRQGYRNNRLNNIATLGITYASAITLAVNPDPNSVVGFASLAGAALGPLGMILDENARTGSDEGVRANIFVKVGAMAEGIYTFAQIQNGDFPTHALSAALLGPAVLLNSSRITTEFPRNLGAYALCTSLGYVSGFNGTYLENFWPPHPAQMSAIAVAINAASRSKLSTPCKRINTMCCFGGYLLGNQLGALTVNPTNPSLVLPIVSGIVGLGLVVAYNSAKVEKENN